jgi:hypothetical protein
MVYGGLARSSRQTGAGLAADLPFGVNIDGGLEPTRETHPGNPHHSHQTKSRAYQKQFHGLLPVEIILRSGLPFPRHPPRPFGSTWVTVAPWSVLRRLTFSS